MPSKYYSRNFVPGYYYHIYNRGSHKQNVFLDKQDYLTFLDILTYYLKFPTGSPRSILNRIKVNKVRNLVSSPTSFHFVCHCLMPNHFHFLIKQTTNPNAETSITNFMRRLIITYAMYFNDKYKHSGNIFQGRYKNVIVKSENQLFYLTKYIHLNPAELRTNPDSYPYSSYSHYLKRKDQPWINSEEILSFFTLTNPKLSYQAFVEDRQTIPDSHQEILLDS